MVLERLATQLSKITPLEFETHLSGSVSEGCKVGLPDEFDYLFIIKNVCKYFDILPSQTSVYASIHKKKVKDFPEDFDYFVNEFDDMIPINLYRYFCQKIYEVLQRSKVWQDKDLYWYPRYDVWSAAFPFVNFWLVCRYHIRGFKNIDVNVDIVPAVVVFSNDRLKLFSFYHNDSDTTKFLPSKSKRLIGAFSSDCWVSMSFVHLGINGHYSIFAKARKKCVHVT